MLNPGDPSSIHEPRANTTKWNSRFWKVDWQTEGVYKRDLGKRIELMIWVLENMKNDGTDICKIIESRMDEIITKIKITDNVFELDR